MLIGYLRIAQIQEEKEDDISHCEKLKVLQSHGAKRRGGHYRLKSSKKR